ncbi:MAG: PAS domain S-box protein [Chloroflexi bacterium]|nr:PAS domain S-box protein [Chloroflexota bacterium]
MTDLNLPDGDVLSLLSYIRSRALPMPVVVITGVGDEETAVNALKAGADDYLVKRANYLARLQAGEHQKRYDVAVFDYKPPGMNALEALKEIRQVLHLDLPVVVVTGQGNNEVAVQILKLGATEYIVKDPGYLFRLPGVIENAFHRWQLAREQAAVRENEARFRAIFEQAAAGIAQVGVDGKFQQVNKKLCAILGYSPEELPERALLDVIYAEDQQDCLTGIHRLLKGEVAAFEREIRCAHKNGSQVWVQLTLSLVQGESPPSLYFVAILGDITARKLTEEARNRLTAIVESTPDLVGTINLENNT